MTNLVEREGVPVDRAIRRAAIRYGESEATIRRNYEDQADAVKPEPSSPERGGTSLAGPPGQRAVWVRKAPRNHPT